MNANLKHAYLIARYLGWDREPLAAAEPLFGSNVFEYLSKRLANLKFVKVVALSRTIVDLRRLIAGPQRMECDGQLLLSGDRIDVVLRVIPYEEVINGKYSLQGCSTFEVAWIFE